MGNAENKRASFSERLTEFLKTKKGQRTLIALLIAAVVTVLLLDADFVKTGKDAVENDAVNENYGERLEQRLKLLLESMSEVGSCEIMITFADSGKTLYVSEVKENKENDKKADGSEKTGYQKEETYIIIDDGNGGETALSEGCIMPQIGGVVVVCDGGAKPAVKEKVINALKTALEIGSDRIYVTDRK